LFLDELVASSEWSGRTQWASEPLNKDPRGGENFFERLRSFTERRRAVKEIYLVCLAMGYHGMYAELDPTQAAAELGKVRQQTLRSIHPEPLDTADVLFPEAYEAAVPLEQQAPPPPRMWIGLSLAGVALAAIVYFVMYAWADDIARPTYEAVRQVPAPETHATADGVAARDGSR
jgi:type VI secretion system protein ImpK